MKVAAFLVLVFPMILVAQGNYSFGPNVKVNDDPGGQAFHTVYSYGAHSIAARGDTVYVAYRGDQTGLSGIYFSKSTDCGQTWTPGLRVSYPEAGIIQSLAVDAKGDIFIAYTHIRDPNYRDIHFTKSTDGGLTFTYPIRLEDDTLPNQNGPCIAVDTSGQKVFVAWNDYRNFSVSGIDIYFTCSTNGGLTFEPNIRVDDTGNDSSWQRRPGIAVDRGGNYIYVTWYDQRNLSTHDDIYFARSTDGGLSFLPNVLVNDTVTTASTDQWQPSIAIDTLGRIFIAWKDDRQPARGCYFARSDDGGLTFGPNVRVTDVPDDNPIRQPSIAVDDSNGVYIAWEDLYRPPFSGDRIYFAFSPNAGDSFYANVRVDDLPPVEEYWLWNPTLAINKDKKVFIAWEDDRNDPTHANPDIYFASGTYVGIHEYAVSKPSVISLQCCPNPFSMKTAISWQKPSCRLQIKIYDVTGRLVRQFGYQNTNESGYRVGWDGRDDHGQILPCGTYFVELSNEEIKEIVKVIKVQ